MYMNIFGMDILLTMLKESDPCLRIWLSTYSLHFPLLSQAISNRLYWMFDKRLIGVEIDNFILLPQIITAGYTSYT